MSGSPSNDLLTVLSNAQSVVRPAENILTRVRRVAFWSAIALPFVYLPMLATGLESPTMTAVFMFLIASNAAALLIGHPHLSE